MRNKGAIWTLAVALLLVCIYQLSFTVVTYKVRTDAKKHALKITRNAEGKLDSLGIKIRDRYLDSIASEEVYNFVWLKKYTYRECQEREINLGLDLRGGMNVILEVSTMDVIRSLANYSKDTTFNRALALARQQQKASNEDFVTLFGKAFESINPNARLSSIFTSQELRNEINYNTSNADVLKVISERANNAISNSFEIIRTRIDHFGVAQPNVQRIEGGDRILVELPGVEEKERVRKLLQGTARLEFWETYENSEILRSLVDANSLIREIGKAGSIPALTPAETADASSPADTSKAETGSDLTLLQQIEADSAAAVDSLSDQAMSEEMPLFTVLKPNVTQNWEPLRGSVFGRVHYKDTAKTNQYLQLAMQKGIFPSDFRYLWSAKPMANPEDRKPTEYYELHAIKITGRDGRPPLTGDVVTQANMQFDQVRGNAEVSMNMDATGTTAWARITRENVGRCIAIVMDDYVYSAPVVNEEIRGGSSSISGDFDTKEATDLANLLKSGTMPAPAKIIQEEVIGPSLGEESIRSGLGSLAVSFLVIFIFMIFYYSRTAGLVADIALFLNMFFLFGVLASLGMALTLPGIAGVILTIGMSVDANVLIYERVREELLAGKGLRMAISDGFKNALSAIIDGNVTTLATGIILFVLGGSGPVKGFATTLVIGICTSLFAAIFITRLVFEMFLEKNANLAFATPVSKGAFKNLHFDFLKNRKIFYGISLSIIIIGIVSLFVRGLDQGVDFAGGRNYIVNFDKPVSNLEIASLLEEPLGTRPTVITYGGADKIRITTKFGIDSDDPGIDEQIQQLLYQGLRPILGNDVTYERFSTQNIQGIQLVGPTIADDIKKRSYLSIFIALVFMFIYIAFRFRNWRFGLGAIASLFHDAFFIIAVFSLLYGFMPFSMEIDQTFVAAILTIIGYSVNDTVVIFDRIREHRKLHPKRGYKDLMNIALNDTLSRTIITSLTVLLTVIIVFIFTGESVMGFAFALLLGLFSGTYSTVFIATALVFDTQPKEVRESVTRS